MTRINRASVLFRGFTLLFNLDLVGRSTTYLGPGLRLRPIPHAMALLMGHGVADVSEGSSRVLET
jgi:hypothetical protein